MCDYGLALTIVGETHYPWMPLWNATVIAMSLDDNEPRPKPQALGSLDLSRLSVAELEMRIVELEGEIVRVRAALESKQKHLAAADTLFGRKS